MIKRIYIVFLLFTLHLGAQNWAPLGKGFDMGFYPRTMVADTINNRLICGGDFKYINSDSLIAEGIATWNGTNWDTLGHRIQLDFGNSCDPVTKLYWLKDTLYADGFFLGSNNSWPNTHAKFNNTTKKWENLILCGTHNFWTNTLMKDTMILAGGPDTVCNLPKAMAVSYDGYNFQSITPNTGELSLHNGNVIHYIFRYKGIWYVAGSFYNDNTNTEFRFAMYNGQHWVPVPGAGTLTQIGLNYIKIYNNELYMSGPFFKSQGAPGNAIVKFDGTNWDDLGGGISTIIDDVNNLGSGFTDFTVYKGNLYATGYFEYKNKAPDFGMAKFDGTQWCNSGEVFQNQVSDIVFLNDTMYIDGGFTAIGTQTLYGVAKRLNLNFTGDCLTAGINELTNATSVKIYPNPTSNYITIQSQDKEIEKSTVKVIDAVGQVVLTLQYSENINISTLSKGYYIVNITNIHGQTVYLKFVKE